MNRHSPVNLASYLDSVDKRIIESGMFIFVKSHIPNFSSPNRDAIPIFAKYFQFFIRLVRMFLQWVVPDLVRNLNEIPISYSSFLTSHLKTIDEIALLEAKSSNGDGLLLT